MIEGRIRWAEGMFVGGRESPSGTELEDIQRQFLMARRGIPHCASQKEICRKDNEIITED
jgi:hypothetical protein